MSLLSIQDLSLSIHGQSILDCVSMDIGPGEICGVIGESGSGKSLTALSVMQLLPEGATCSGSIALSDIEILQADEQTLCNIRGRAVGMVFQEPMTALNPVQTIGQQVAETIRIHQRVSRSDAMVQAAKTLRKCELPQERFPLSRYPHELSGGQRQRVVIAMAIALQPKLLIADEPTTALDVTTQAEILRLLQRLVAEDGMGLMLITHDLAVVTDIADHIIIMNNGKVVERGQAKALYSNMDHPYTKSLFKASTHQPERLGQVEDTVLLSVQNVVRDYPMARKSLIKKPAPFRALNDVSFNIYKGECLGLVGESGCGKSTLTRAIMGLDDIQGGVISLNGKDVFADETAREKMQVVFQDPYGSFNPRHKVGRLVSEPFFRLGRSATNDEIVESLVSVGLEAEDRNKYIHEFSGGQRQRIAIARALILEPKLIILDEPTSALDMTVQKQIVDLLLKLQKELSLTYVFISHDLKIVRALSDEIIVMKSGEVVERGTAEKIFLNPKNSYTKNLINSAFI